MRRSTTLLLSALALCPFTLSNAQTTVTTDPVGFVSKSCLANSDTILSAPFMRLPEFVGAIQSVAGSVITVSGTPWTANQFVYAAGSQPNTYFALIGPHASTNPNEGRIYKITANSTNTLTVNLNGDSISGVQSSTQLLVVPYWTLGTLFPASDVNVSYISSPSVASRQTQILVPNYSGSGINLSTTATYFYFNDAWRKFGTDPTISRNDDTLEPTGYFILRNAGTGTTLTALGSVLVKKESIFLRTNTSSKQDNFVSITRPVDVKLDDLGLISSGAFAASPSVASRTDELFVFNNAASGINKSASATYFYFNGAWRKFGQDPTINVGQTATIPAGDGFMIRKAASGGGASVVWQNTPTY